MASTSISGTRKTACLRNWINDQYGSNRGLARYCRFKLQYRMGGFQTYRQIDWPYVDRLVFVCKGNVCRSAFAEAVCRSRGYESVSCGIDTVEGGAANETAIQVAGSRGIDLRDHKTTSIKNLSPRKNDLLIAMEPWQAIHLESMFGKKNACTLLGLWGPHANPYIHDPFLATKVFFNRCFSAIELSVDEITGKINK